jgi:hypothetical protein
VQTRGQAEKPNPEPSRDGDRALRPEIFPLERERRHPFWKQVGNSRLSFSFLRKCKTPSRSVFSSY